MSRFREAHVSFVRALEIAFAAIAIFRRLGAIKEVEALERRFASMA
jgi:hypothetical protein